MKNDMAAQVVLAQLGQGADQAKPLGKIAETLGWNRRSVELAIQSLRMESWPVCSGNEGIWLGDAADLAETYETLRHRMRSQAVTAAAVRRTLRRMRNEQVQQLSWTGEAA